MGNNNSGVDFVIKLDKEFYFSSEEVRGHLFINAKKRYPCLRIILEIQGVQSCEFRAADNQKFQANKKLIHTSYVLAEFGHNQYLEGQNDFPFTFRFLEYLPGSFKEEKQYKAQVVYFIKSIILSKDRKADILQKKVEIIIRQPQRSGERMLSGQTYALCRNCFCLERGVSRIYCYFQRNFYLPGQECIMICEVDNTKCQLEVTRVKCQLIKEVVLTDANGTQRSFTELLNTVFFPGVGPQHSYFGQNAQRQTLKLVYKDSPRAITPSTHGHYVRCQYYVLVEPLFGGCFTKVSDSQFKVYLTILQPPNVYQQIVQPQDWKPDIRQKSTIFLDADPYSSNEQLSSMNSWNNYP